MSTALKNSMINNAAKDNTGDAINGSEVDANPNTLADVLDGTTATDLGGAGAVDFLALRSITLANAATSIQRPYTIEWDPADVGNLTDNSSGLGIVFKMPDDAGNQDEYAAFDAMVVSDATTEEEGEFSLKLRKAGTLTELLTLAPTTGLRLGVNDTGYDVQFFGAAAGAYMLWDESANALDVRGATAAGAGTLKLTTGELTVVDGDVLGRIDFQAPLESDGTDAILVSASIWAEADDTFAADNNATSLVFASATSETATAVMRLSKTALSPQTTDGLSLGTSALNFSDLFLDSGAVVNFDSGDVTVTHSSNTLTVAGGTFATAALTATSLSVGDGNITNVGQIDVDSIVSDGSTVTIGTGSTMVFTDNTTIAMTLGNDAGDDFIIDTNVFVVEGDNGHVGIGTATPAYWFNVAAQQDYDWVAQIQNTEATDGRNYGLRVRGGSTSADTALAVEDHDGANAFLTIKGDGGVIAANLLAAAASTDLNINGSNEIHSVTSSEIFKDDIVDIDIDSSKIYDLKLRSWDWAENSGSAGMHDFGIIAEETAEIIPEIVVMRKDKERKSGVGESAPADEKVIEVGKAKPYSIRNSPLMMLMLDQMQKLNTRIVALEA